MNLDVKNLAFGAVGEKVNLDLAFKNSEIAEDLFVVSLKGKIKLTRLADSILAEVRGQTVVRVECDRCLETFELERPFEFSREYLLGSHKEAADELLVSKHFEIDLRDPLREEIILSLPIKKLCRKSCKGLCAGCGTNLNSGECKCKV